MTLSRTHLAFLGIVSLFTGVISPVVRTTGGVFPFPLTDLQMSAYVILCILAILCICLTYRAWGLVRIGSTILLIVIALLYMSAIRDGVHTSTGILTIGLSWGWIFFIVGLICLLWSGWGDILDGEPNMSDKLLSLLAGMTILGLTILIIWISYVPSQERAMRNRIIERTLGTGSTETHSGISLSRAYQSIDKLIFDRSHDTIRFFVSSSSGMVSIPSGHISDRLPYSTLQIKDAIYTISADGTISTESGDILGSTPMPQDFDDMVLIVSGSGLYSISRDGIRSYPGAHADIGHVTSSGDGSHMAWTESRSGTTSIYRDGVQIARTSTGAISHLTLSYGGDSLMTVEKGSDGISYLTRDGIRTDILSSDMIPSSLQINGTNSIYAVDRDHTISIIYDGALLDRKLDEVRDIFLDSRSSEYAFFGRPLGERTYCLYTRYHGNLCGLSGYMNPRIAPDGSIVYAGLKDGIWGIYRDTNSLISNTGYPNTGDISRDYVFFDMTNPKSYLFINGQVPYGYRLYKRGAWIPGSWKDVGLDPGFGYDNKVIMSVEDESGWRVIEF